MFPPYRGQPGGGGPPAPLPPELAAPEEVPEETPGTYVVQDGDTWESIAAELGVDVGQLMAMNPDVQDLTAGTVLQVPVAEEMPEMGGGEITPEMMAEMMGPPRP